MTTPNGAAAHCSLNQDEPQDGDLHLTAREAFQTMSSFLWEYANRAGDDLITLLGDIAIEDDGQPTDPAAWDDWISCVGRIKTDGIRDDS